MKTKMILIALTTALATAGLLRAAPERPVTKTTEAQKILYYTCPMHPSVKADKPGDCTICGMKLVAVYAETTTNAPASTNTPVAAPASCCGVSCPMNVKQ
jgi:membrane fusion protein, copper/silver efflux system